MAKILVVDDESNILTTMSSILQDEGHTVYSSETGQGALDFLKTNMVDLAILDIWLPDFDGLDLLKKIKAIYSDIGIIMISGHGSIDIAVQSTRLGAFDFMEKPPSLDRVITSVNNALEHVRLIRENKKLKQKSFIEDDMIGNSPEMNGIREIIQKAAKTNARLFITGESGTGKELVARAIYQLSNRSDRPFIKVNCAAIPDELIESELFGHEKGAFTGALGKRIGKFELADHGTLFLDEVCDMSLAAQAKVLRVLQEQQLERVGGNTTVNVDVRVLAATNVDVKKAIREGTFREDLYYRLNVIPIQVPRLAERKPDIPLLVNFFMDKFSREHGTGIKAFTDSALEFMSNYQWPGNVRELKNIIERVIIMVQEEEIDVDDIKENFDFTETSAKFGEFPQSGLKAARENFEREFIIEALKNNDKNVSMTARNLDIERTNLHRKIKQYGINMDEI